MNATAKELGITYKNLNFGGKGYKWQRGRATADYVLKVKGITVGQAYIKEDEVTVCARFTTLKYQYFKTFKIKKNMTKAALIVEIQKAWEPLMDKVLKRIFTDFINL